MQYKVLHNSNTAHVFVRALSGLFDATNEGVYKSVPNWNRHNFHVHSFLFYFFIRLEVQEFELQGK